MKQKKRLKRKEDINGRRIEEIEKM